MANTYRIQVLTSKFVPELGRDYEDVQYFDVPENKTIKSFKAEKEAEINAEQDKRIAARIYEKNNPPPVVEPTKEQLQAQLDDLAAKSMEIQGMISEKDKG